jgi:hypothetical protein
MSSYPEHEKLAKISDKSTACGLFVEWLAAEKGIRLAGYHEHAPECYDSDGDETCGMSTTSDLFAVTAPLTKLLAEFFEIDENKIEAEKRAMLDELRRRVDGSTLNTRSGT